MKKLTFKLNNLSDFEKGNLRDFASSWLAWAKAGGHSGSGPQFSRGSGLCNAASIWDQFIGSPSVSIDRGMTENFLFMTFRAQFESDELISRHFPFNEGIHTDISFDKTEYYRECSRYECHVNPNRIDWLEQLIAAIDESIKESK